MSAEPSLERRANRWARFAGIGIPFLLLVTAIVLATWVVGRGVLVAQSGAANSYPETGSVDAGFLRDMQVHHAQAVEMALIIRDRTGNPAVRTIALDIELTQQHQVGQMYALLASWALPQSDAQAPMSWMQGSGSGHGPEPSDDPGAGQSEGAMGDMSAGDHSVDDTATMPGMASDASLQRLSRMSGTQAERLFLQLMIAHHQGGLGMAEYARSNAGDDQVRLLAGRIVEAQEPEINVLEQMLSDRGGPLPERR